MVCPDPSPPNGPQTIYKARMKEQDQTIQALHEAHAELDGAEGAQTRKRGELLKALMSQASR